MDIVHGYHEGMRTIPAGQFKQTCLQLLDEVAETRESIVVTKRGRPVAELVPLPRTGARAWIGGMERRGSVGELADYQLDAADWGDAWG